MSVTSAVADGLNNTEYVAVRERPIYEAIKRVTDIAVSLIALIVFSPLLLVVSLCIKIEDGGPVIFKQTRLTKGGKSFVMYKFRSMYVNAEKDLDAILPGNEMNGPVFKMKDDKRITKIGRFIRKYSIDELPQLVNIMKGDMSIIGPRPPLPREVEQYTEYQMHRLDVKTGLATYREVMGRNNIKDFDEWVRLDLKYIQERGLWTDIKIFLLMFKAVVTAEGAG